MTGTIVSVLTPTISERAAMLDECCRTVASQTHEPLEHIIALDEDRIGCARIMNACAEQATGEWLIPLADDDLLLPGCVASLLEHSEDADVIYAPPLVTGNEDRWWFFQAPPAIPSFGLIRRTLWEQLGGYNEELKHEEDRDFWTRALKVAARFVRVDEPCWVYRQHIGNKSFNKAVAA